MPSNTRLKKTPPPPPSHCFFLFCNRSLLNLPTSPLAVGLATRAVAALVTGVMAVAVLQVHLANGFFWTNGGFEYPLLWGVVALGFVLRGGGRLSLDGALGREI